MTRQDFIKMCGLLGISIPFQSVLASYQPNNKNTTTKFDGSVLIIGAGAAGLTAGYLLQQQGIDFQIVEASSTYGGRMKRVTDFVDFPIPLGAEWLHVKRDVFDEIVNDSSIKITTKTTLYDYKTDYALYEGEEVSLKDMGFKIDQKFINSTWFDFFEQYVVPFVKDKITYNQAVQSIDYTRNEVIVKTSDNQWTADKVILTVPVKQLQKKVISFSPQLPEDKLKAIDKVTVWDGFKAFIEFSEKFYPTAIAFDSIPAKDGEKMYYDASYGQNSDRHVLGLFTVGTGTLPYRELSDDALKGYILNELDEMFDGKASASYVKHISQNWNEEPFINGAYIYSYESWRRVRKLGTPVDNKLFFAGTVYTDGEDWSSVHTAARSAITAIHNIL